MVDAFYDYVRGRTDTVPQGYQENGMRVYRHLVYLGASQMVATCFPAVRTNLDEQDWRQMIEAFVRQSTWCSPYYGDLQHEFLAFLDRENQPTSE